jgi:hypothetical protein
MTLVKKQKINADFDKAHDLSFFRGVRDVLSFRKFPVNGIPIRCQKMFCSGVKIEFGYVMDNWVRRYKTESLFPAYRDEAARRLGKTFSIGFRNA